MSLVVLLLVIAGVAGLIVFDQVRERIAASDILPDFTIRHNDSGEVAYDPGQPLPRWEGTERVNVLVMGVDERQNEDGPWRTDTMLVLTIDPVTMSAGMLSIPRDLWVPIPGFEEGRINTAHYLGDLYDYPGGGPALAAKTVQYNLGVPIHYYARVNFTAFEQTIDLIGGIDVYLEEEINDPLYPDEAYGYDPLYIAAGWQHFDGRLALKYARTRHSEGSDFDRAKRQQQVLTAVFEKVTSFDLLPQLAPRLPELWETFEDAVVTNMTLDQIVALARLASEVEAGDVRYGMIDEHYTQFWETPPPEKYQVLIPVRERIRELRDYIFTAEAPPPQVEDPAARLAAEAATIEVLNGTTTPGLAGSTAGLLERHNLHVERIDNADRDDRADSLVIVYTGKTYTADYIVNVLGLPPSALVLGNNPAAEYDISLILGADYRPPATEE